MGHVAPSEEPNLDSVSQNHWPGLEQKRSCNFQGATGMGLGITVGNLRVQGL